MKKIVWLFMNLAANVFFGIIALDLIVLRLLIELIFSSINCQNKYMILTITSQITKGILHWDHLMKVLVHVVKTIELPTMNRRKGILYIYF